MPYRANLFLLRCRSWLEDERRFDEKEDGQGVCELFASADELGDKCDAYWMPREEHDILHEHLCPDQGDEYDHADLRDHGWTMSDFVLYGMYSTYPCLLSS